MPTISRHRLAFGLLTLLERHPRAPVVKVVAQEIVRNRRHHELELIVGEVARLLFAKHAHLEAQVVSVHPLPAALTAHVSRFLKYYYGARSVTLQSTIDPSLRGGAIVRTPLGTLDASIITQLTRLQHAL